MAWALFVSKKIVSSILCPSMIALLLWFVGFILWRRNPRGRLGIGCIVAGGVVLLLCSIPFFSIVLIGLLEDAAGPPADPSDLRRQGVQHIVVLGGGVQHGSFGTPSLPGSDSLARVVEGVRLWNGVPDARLILSGGKYRGTHTTSADAMAWMAKLQGVPDRAIILEDKSWDTDDEAQYIRSMVGERPFALVTSAAHMKRALLTFRLWGLDPVPAPTDYMVRGVAWDFMFLLPSSLSLVRTRMALREYTGSAWLTLKSVRARDHR